jgi:hypothetical protein
MKGGGNRNTEEVFSTSDGILSGSNSMRKDLTTEEEFDTSESLSLTGTLTL